MIIILPSRVDDDDDAEEEEVFCVVVQNTGLFISQSVLRLFSRIRENQAQTLWLLSQLQLLLSCCAAHSQLSQALPFIT